MRATPFGKLDCSRADAAGGPGDEDPFRAEATALDHPLGSGKGTREARQFDVAEPGFNLDCVIRPGNRIIRKTPIAFRSEGEGSNPSVCSGVGLHGADQNPFADAAGIDPSAD